MGGFAATMVGLKLMLVMAAICGSCGGETPADTRAAAASLSGEAPFGALDFPRPNARVGRVMDVVGWALDDSGIRRVHVEVDGHRQASVQPTIPRPDVHANFPKYGGHVIHPGWQVSVDLGPAAGGHEIVVRAEDDGGATSEIGRLVVTLIDR